MKNVNFLKTSLKYGVLSSNLLNFNAMENIINLNTNVEINNIYDEKEKEKIKIEIQKQLKEEYQDEHTNEIVYRIIKRANPNNLEKYKNPYNYTNSSDIIRHFNRLKDAVIRKEEEKKLKNEIKKIVDDIINNIINKEKDKKNKNEIIINNIINKEEYKKENLKDLISNLNPYLIDGIIKYIKQIYMFPLFEYNYNLLDEFCGISEEQYKYFNKFVVTVNVYGDKRVINTKDYNGKVNVEKISEDKYSGLKEFKIFANKKYLKKLFYRSQIENVLEIRNYVDKYEKVDLERLFGDCRYLKNINFKGFNTENVINMSRMFLNCCSLEKLDLKCFNIDRVINMSRMFLDCLKLTELDLSSFNTKNVKIFYKMFVRCKNLKELDLSSFNFKNAENCCLMFSGCNKLTNLILKNFDFSNISTASYMCYDCEELVKVIIGKEENVIIGKKKYAKETSSISCNKEKTINFRNMFENCIKLKNLEFYIPGDLNIINIQMFYKCFKLLQENFKTNIDDLRKSLNDKN